MRVRLLRSISSPAVLTSLRDRQINYDMGEVRRPHWNFDLHRYRLGTEPPGPPVDGGLWHAACRLVRDYEFTPPEVLRAAYFHRAPLLGRDLLLEGRFAFMRFLMGVRITELLDRTRDGQQVWGWSYETLEGHLERGRVDYEVFKDLDSGVVEFVARSYSQMNPHLALVFRLGWAIFGRRKQLRFYRRIGERLQALACADWAGEPDEQHGVVVVPSGVRPQLRDRFAVYIYDPATRPGR